ncbi:uncharacterized protein BDR25DRAFT_361160 [Lindgomyces ingoldianus]|uniref:Uncharacterized protein n=1 Tax=Lindgomyces ingoldianus TaxID=673940 RepID=A0ACB6QD39_9PLEO|nr:uncharacterized protein BDR25DRAFT_361160 [Lindgomyces ingoldianus]KAF2464939.1 hypothetical protein BDR25DRAFT_361160 [Lindgomyces ingoldianus]
MLVATLGVVFPNFTPQTLPLAANCGCDDVHQQHAYYSSNGFANVSLPICTLISPYVAVTSLVHRVLFTGQLRFLKSFRKFQYWYASRVFGSATITTHNIILPLLFWFCSDELWKLGLVALHILSLGLDRLPLARKVWFQFGVCYYLAVRMRRLDVYGSLHSSFTSSSLQSPSVARYAAGRSSGWRYIVACTDFRPKMISHYISLPDYFTVPSGSVFRSMKEPEDNRCLPVNISRLAPE